MTAARGGGLVWHLWLDPVPRPGWENMALDQALLERAAQLGDGFLRLYRWNPFCLSFGRHEPAARRYSRDAIAQRGIAVVRRPTGGRAVWHARELTYAVAAPAEALGSLAEAYRSIHRMLAGAVGTLGAAAALAPPQPTPPLGAGACFAQPVGGEVLVGGRKVVGSAQLREGGGLLQHGSMLLEDDQRLVADLQTGPAGPGGEAPLSALLGRPIGFDEAAAAVIGAARNWQVGWRTLSDPGPLVAAAGHHAARFRSDQWTWRR